MEETVTISKKEYDKLIKDRVWLNCLERAGVDNWEGHDIAVDFMEEHYPEED